MAKLTSSSIAKSIGTSAKAFALPDDPSIPESNTNEEKAQEPKPQNQPKAQPQTQGVPLNINDKHAIFDMVIRSSESISASNMTTVAIRSSYNQILQTLSSSCQLPQKVILDNILSLFLSQNSEISILEQIRNKVMSNTKQLM